MVHRREFLRRAAIVGGALGAGMVPERLQALRPLRILILGGTGFIGPHQVRYALKRGHTVTLFNRGRTAPELFPKLEQLRGDRAEPDLSALEGDREWDVVIDNSASNPDWVKDSAGLLAGRAGQYIFISTQSVYASRAQIGIDETAPVGRPDLPKSEWRGYGPGKALCEEEARAAFPGAATVIRPSLIVGPGDRTDRWTYWPVRIHRGGTVVAPGTPEDPMQFIDARDLSDWIIRVAENRIFGTFNAVGPEGTLTLAGMLYGIKAVTTSDARFVWVDAELLSELGVRAWSDMPAWMVPAGRTAGFARMSNARALAAGLTFRPLAVTARDTLEWFFTLPADRRANLGAGLTPEREAFVLSAWRVRNGSLGRP